MQPGLTASGSAAYAAASLTFHTTIEDSAWDQWLAAQPNAHVLQLSGWRKLKQRFGWGGCHWRARALTLQAHLWHTKPPQAAL